MSQEGSNKKEKKEAMKALRGSRKEWVAKASSRFKTQKKVLKTIRGHLEKGDGTVPEIADATGMPTDEVLWYVAGMKKYGEIVEGKKDGGYFRYALAESMVQEAS